MHVVARPEVAPGHCIVTLAGEDPGGFIDTGLTPPVVDPRIYVSRQAVIDMARHFGFPTPEEHARLIEDFEDLAVKFEQVKEENVELTRDVEAAEWTLERKFQSKPQRKPGPRKAA